MSQETPLHKLPHKILTHRSAGKDLFLISQLISINNNANLQSVKIKVSVVTNLTTIILCPVPDHDAYPSSLLGMIGKYIQVLLILFCWLISTVCPSPWLLTLALLICIICVFHRWVWPQLCDPSPPEQRHFIVKVPFVAVDSLCLLLHYLITNDGVHFYYM